MERDLDDLWPPFPSGPRRGDPPSRSDLRDQRRHEQVHDVGRRSPGRVRSRLSKAEIIDAAIAIADTEGADALSMRRIAQVLRAGTMSLYWHVANKDHLLELMRDTLMTEVTVPEPSGDWQADLRATAISLRAMLSRHRWLLQFVGGRPPLGPATLLQLERQLAILADLKLGTATDFDILTALNTYVTGAVQRETEEIRTHEAERELLDATPDAESQMQAWRDRLAATGLFPNVIKFVDARVDPDALETMDGRFEFGLDCLLDGVADRIVRR